MATTYSLKITQIDCLPSQNNLNNVVIKAHWAYTGTTEDNRSAGYGGTTEISYVDGDPFIPYDQLTEEQVSGWVLSSWSQELTDSYRNIIESQLSINSGQLPWANAVETPVDESTPPV